MLAQETETEVAEDIQLDIIYEDDHLLVINKPVGLVVHPAAGHHSGTLVNRLLAHAPDMAALPRGGIVHRLDKDTSGIMLAARSPLAHRSLVAQLADRSAVLQKAVDERRLKIQPSYFDIDSGTVTLL